METLGGFPFLPALWLRRAKPASANAVSSARYLRLLRLSSSRGWRRERRGVAAGGNGLVELHPRDGLLLTLRHECLRTFRRALGERAETRLLHGPLFVGHLRRLRVELQRVLALGVESGVEPVQRPRTRLDGHGLVIQTLGHVDAVGDAVAVRDDDRR